MPATTAQCPNGGVVVIFAQDTMATGVLSAGDADLESAVVCNGSDGKPGASGPQGPQGVAGSSCTTTVVNPGVMAPQGGAAISCQDGTTALILNGTPGQRGAEGSPGIVVTPIQFCGTSSNSYPDVFNEIGFCIDGNIYAVYSQNGGFLTEIGPGNYSSDGINSSCNFTVASNCVVTH
jgi:hypothetical protein